MKYTTALKELEFYGYHGLYAEEKVLGGNFRVDMKVTMDIAKPIATLDDAVNYEVLFNTAKEEMAVRQDLIETVAQNILNRLQEHFGKEGRIELTIYKPNPAGLFKSGIASVMLSNAQ
ncbi:MAG: dihydroneopterin aldolase [Bacteroidota bacterium]